MVKIGDRRPENSVDGMSVKIMIGAALFSCSLLIFRRQ
jgi:hypothetical protein